MASIHTGSIILTNAAVALPLSATRVGVRQLFIQCNAAFSVGASNVTPTTGILCSAVGTGAAQNAPHTPCLGTTAAMPIINLAEVFCVSATPGAVINFLYIA